MSVKPVPNNVITIIDRQPSFRKQLIYSAISALFFIVVSLPDTYKKTTYLTRTNTMTDNCPTPEGKFIHTAVFFIINFVMMKIANSYKQTGELSDGLIAKYSFYGALLFFMLSSSDTYRLTSRVLGGNLGNDGCPNVNGILVHALVFAVVLVLVMSFPKDTPV